MIHEFKKMASWTTIGHIFFIRSISFSFFNPSHQNHFLIKFCRRLKRLMSKMLWFACVRPFFHPFCLHICKYVQHSDGHCRLKKCPKFALPWPTFWPLLVRYDVKTEELKVHMVISVSNWGIRFSSNKGILKGQEISKQNCQAITSPKERTDKIAFLSWWLRNKYLKLEIKI